jgi:hypothetical protein
MVEILAIVLNLTIYIYAEYILYDYIKVLLHIDYCIYNTASKNLNTMLNAYTKI